MIGQLLDGRYQIIRTLGAGGFGQTFIAEDQRRPGHPTCVVKHLKPASSDPKFLETARRLFHSEAETLEKLGNQHAQIPRLLAFFEQEQEFYLVQELIEGQTLSTELLPGKPWAEEQVIRLLKEVLNILKFVHEQGVIHRDVKPDNIIRRQADQKLFLVDFGAVKQVRTQMATVQGQMSATIAVGTPGYMPSEQGQGKPRASSDIYALGMIGIQALTGIRPSELQEDLETGEIIWQQQANVSPGLADVISKMVKCYFKERYTSAAEALQALQQLQSGYTPTQQASSPQVFAALLTPTATAQPASQLPVGQTTLLAEQPITQEQVATNLQPQRAGVPKGLLVVGCLLSAAIFSLGVVIALPRLNPVVGNNSIPETPENKDTDPSPEQPDQPANSTQPERVIVSSGGTTARPTVPSRSNAVPQATRPASPGKANQPTENHSSGQTKPSEPATPLPKPVDQGAVTLDEAWVQADAGNFENAIAIAQSIPQSSAAYPEAQELIGSWQATLNQPAPAQPEQAIECSAYASGSVSQLSDVSPTDAYFQAVQTAIEAWGVLGGCTDGTFKGNSPATQADYDAVQTAMTQSGLDANCVYNYLSGGQSRYQLASTVTQIQQACYADSAPSNQPAPAEAGPI